MAKALWSGRFDSAPDPAAFDFGVSFPFDRRLFEDDVTGSLAWAEALARAGILDETDAASIRDGLQAILDQGCKVLGEVTLGVNVVVWANSLVLKDGPSNSIVLGNPARIETRGLGEHRESAA
jgi:argininosuccinate lyase